MEKDFSRVKYLKFSAIDPEEAEFCDIVINLETDKIESGMIKIGEEGDDKVIVNGLNKWGNLVNPEYSIYAAVGNNGSYYLLDEKLNPLYEHHGNVPKLMKYYNEHSILDNCIDIKIVDLEKSLLAHAIKHKINFNDPDDWQPVMTDMNKKYYAYGIEDAYDSIRKIINNNDNAKDSMTAILALINNFKREDI